jgi:proteasome accessory factor C
MTAEAPRGAKRKRRRSGGRTLTRLERILLLVPYCVRHPGVSIEELADRFGATTRDIVEDLNLVFMCGLPDYTPADLIEVYVEEDRVWIRMADYFARPLRLTRSEAIPLYLKAHALLDLLESHDGRVPGLEELSSLRSALGKLAVALLPQEGGVAELAKRIHVHLETGEARWLPLLREAITSRQCVQMEYYSYSRDAITRRKVDPYLVFSSLGHWYVSGWCHLAVDRRMFRLDRIKSIELTDERFEPPEVVDELPPPTVYVPGPTDVPVTLRVSTRVAAWLAEEYLQIESASDVEGGRELVFRTSQFPWLEKLLLQFGEDVTVVDPPELAQRVRDSAARILALYQRKPAKR